ncbi:hypothetical protein INR49_027795, partial [Caranx melampygus]
MEGAMEDWEESTESGTTSTQVDTEAQDYREHDDEPLNLQEPEGDNRVDSDACPGVVEPSQETLTDTNAQDDADSLSSTPLPREEALTHPSLSSHP